MCLHRTCFPFTDHSHCWDHIGLLVQSQNEISLENIHISIQTVFYTTTPSIFLILPFSVIFQCHTVCMNEPFCFLLCKSFKTLLTHFFPDFHQVAVRFSHDFSAKQYASHAALGLYCMLPRAQTNCILSRSTLFHVLLCLQAHSTKCWTLSLYRTVLSLLSGFRVLQAL